MYHLSPFTYLIEALLGQGVIVLSFPGVSGRSAYPIFFQLSVASSLTALIKNWLPSNLLQRRVAEPSWLNISPVSEDTLRILMPPPIVVSVQAGPRTNGWDQASTFSIAITGEISEFFVPIFYSM